MASGVVQDNYKEHNQAKIDKAAMEAIEALDKKRNAEQARQKELEQAKNEPDVDWALVDDYIRLAIKHGEYQALLGEKSRLGKMEELFVMSLGQNDLNKNLYGANGLKETVVSMDKEGDINPADSYATGEIYKEFEITIDVEDSSWVQKYLALQQARQDRQSAKAAAAAAKEAGPQTVFEKGAKVVKSIPKIPIRIAKSIKEFIDKRKEEKEPQTPESILKETMLKELYAKIFADILEDALGISEKWDYEISGIDDDGYLRSDTSTLVQKNEAGKIHASIEHGKLIFRGTLPSGELNDEVKIKSRMFLVNERVKAKNDQDAALVDIIEEAQLELDDTLKSRKGISLDSPQKISTEEKTKTLIDTITEIGAEYGVRIEKCCEQNTYNVSKNVLSQFMAKNAEAIYEDLKEYAAQHGYKEVASAINPYLRDGGRILVMGSKDNGVIHENDTDKMMLTQICKVMHEMELFQKKTGQEQEQDLRSYILDPLASTIVPFLVSIGQEESAIIKPTSDRCFYQVDNISVKVLESEHSKQIREGNFSFDIQYMPEERDLNGNIIQPAEYAVGIRKGDDPEYCAVLVPIKPEDINAALIGLVQGKIEAMRGNEMSSTEKVTLHELVREESPSYALAKKCERMCEESGNIITDKLGEENQYRVSVQKSEVFPDGFLVQLYVENEGEFKCVPVSEEVLENRDDLEQLFASINNGEYLINLETMKQMTDVSYIYEGYSDKISDGSISCGDLDKVIQTESQKRLASLSTFIELIDNSKVQVVPTYDENQNINGVAIEYDDVNAGHNSIAVNADNIEILPFHLMIQLSRIGADSYTAINGDQAYDAMKEVVSALDNGKYNAKELYSVLSHQTTVKELAAEKTERPVAERSSQPKTQSKKYNGPSLE